MQLTHDEIIARPLRYVDDRPWPTKLACAIQKAKLKIFGPIDWDSTKSADVEAFLNWEA